MAVQTDDTNQIQAAVDPTALSVDQAARMLGVERAWIEADVAAGAPTNADGSINLVRYGAWLNLMAREDDRGET